MYRTVAEENQRVINRKKITMRELIVLTQDEIDEIVKNMPISDKDYNKWRFLQDGEFNEISLSDRIIYRIDTKN